MKRATHYSDGRKIPDSHVFYEEIGALGPGIFEQLDNMDIEKMIEDGTLVRCSSDHFWPEEKK